MDIIYIDDDVHDNVKDTKNNRNYRTTLSYYTTKFSVQPLYTKMARMSLYQNKNNENDETNNNNNKMLSQIKEEEKEEEENTLQNVSTTLKPWFPPHTLLPEHTKEWNGGGLCKCKKFKRPLFESEFCKPKRRPKRCKAYYCVNI